MRTRARVNEYKIVFSSFFVYAIRGSATESATTTVASRNVWPHRQSSVRIRYAAGPVSILENPCFLRIHVSEFGDIIRQLYRIIVKKECGVQRKCSFPMSMFVLYNDSSLYLLHRFGTIILMAVFSLFIIYQLSINFRANRKRQAYIYIYIIIQFIVPYPNEHVCNISYLVRYNTISSFELCNSTKQIL